MAQVWLVGILRGVVAVLQWVIAAKAEK